MKVFIAYVYKQLVGIRIIQLKVVISHTYYGNVICSKVTQLLFISLAINKQKYSKSLFSQHLSSRNLQPKAKLKVYCTAIVQRVAHNNMLLCNHIMRHHLVMPLHPGNTK